MNTSYFLAHPQYLILTFAIVLSGCSAGRTEQSRLIPAEHSDGIRISQNYKTATLPCLSEIPPLAEDSTNRHNTIFVHPGLLLLDFNWDHSLAVEAGKILTMEKIAGKMLELRDRDFSPIYQHALKDPGTEFIGLHYSMGGRPDIIRGSLDAIRKASQEKQTPLRYHAILFDPFAISEISNQIDINEPELGYVFILLSREHSFLRPSIEDLPKSFADSKKLFFVFTEDFNESWGHFGMLNAFLEQSTNDPKHAGGKKMRSLFNAMASIALGDKTPYHISSPPFCPESRDQKPQLVNAPPINSPQKM